MIITRFLRWLDHHPPHPKRSRLHHHRGCGDPGGISCSEAGMSAHIPGPWEIIETPDAVMVSEWHIKIGTEMLLPFFPYKRKWSEDRQQSGLVFDGEKMAAAKLIVAAPDLLHAMKTMEAYWQSGNFTRRQDLWDMMRSAIAKAEEK